MFQGPSLSLNRLLEKGCFHFYLQIQRTCPSSDCTNVLLAEPVSSFIGVSNSSIDEGLLTGMCVTQKQETLCKAHCFLSYYILPVFPQQLVSYGRYW